MNTTQDELDTLHRAIHTYRKAIKTCATDDEILDTVEYLDRIENIYDHIKADMETLGKMEMELVKAIPVLEEAEKCIAKYEMRKVKI